MTSLPHQDDHGSMGVAGGNRHSPEIGRKQQRPVQDADVKLLYTLPYQQSQVKNRSDDLRAASGTSGSDSLKNEDKAFQGFSPSSPPSPHQHVPPAERTRHTTALLPTWTSLLLPPGHVNTRSSAYSAACPQSTYVAPYHERSVRAATYSLESSISNFPVQTLHTEATALETSHPTRQRSRPAPRCPDFLRQ
jgi:hypothetical protein